MTSLAGALNDTDLGEYRGKRITHTSIAIRNAGDGLSDAMEIEPEVLEPGTTVFVLLECEVGEHGLKLVDKADSYELKQVLKAGTATIVDDQGSRKKIAAQRLRIEKAQEAAKGVQRIPGTEDVTDGQPEGSVTAIDAKSAAAGERPEPEWNDDPDPDND